MNTQDTAGTLEVDVCWVCLAPGDSVQPLIQACQCPRAVHKGCLARWQLQSAGRSEETECRFCHKELPNWRVAYNLPTANPVMTVSHNNVQHLLHVKPGDAGRKEFQDNIRMIFGLDLQDVINLDFCCKTPGNQDQDLSLKGWQSYDAAVHCAAVSAAARQGHWKSTTAGKHHAQPMQTFCKHLNHHEASVSQAWPASAPVQRGLSATSTAAPVRYEARPAGITRDSLSMQHTRTAVASTSLLPALLSRLHAGAKRSRQGYES